MRGLESRELAKETAYIYCSNLIFYILLLKWILKNKIIMNLERYMVFWNETLAKVGQLHYPYYGH